MQLKIRVNRFSPKIGRFLTCAFVLAGFLLCLLGARAQSPPNYPTNIALQSWSFYDPTTWPDDAGYAPVSFTNITYSSLGYGPTLVVDTNIPAWLKYNVVENNGTTNLTLNFGTTTFWFAPESWSSTNAGGVGPGEYGRLLEVGNYSANSSYGLWSIYVDSGGNNLYFSAQTNDLSSNLTTYVCAPISWTTNYFHFVALSYSSTNTILYLDGVQATNGPGVTVYPGPNVLTNGFCIGSDTNGIYQAHGLFDLVQTYNYPLDSNDVQTLFSYYYSDFMIDPENIGYMDDFNLDYFSISTTTNLAISPLTISNNTASLFVVNSAADVLYEIQGCTNLARPNWFTEAFVDGSELTNWTWANFYVSKQGDLFLRIRNWQDTTGTGIPDWWWLEYFGQTTNVNAYASDPPGDGYTDLQKYQMGLNPTNYYNPNPPGGFFGYLDPSGTNAFIAWNPAPGPVLNYAIRRGIQGTNGGFVYSQIGLVNSNATFFEDVGSITNANTQNNIYTLTAVYPGACYSGTDVWMVAWYTGYASDGPPYGPPLAQNAYAYADTTGTNVLLSWTLPAGPATNCIIEHGIYDTTNSSYIYYAINHVSTSTILYEAVGGLTNANNWGDDYGLVAVYPGGGLSALASSAISHINDASIHVGSYSGPAAPTNFYGYTDSTGTNNFLTWNLSPSATNYILWGGYIDYSVGDYGTYVYHLITHVGAATNAFEVVGDTSDTVFALVAVYPGNNQSQAADWNPGNGAPAPGALYAYLDGTGTNVQLSWSAAAGNTTGYLVQRSDYFGGYYEVGQVGPNTTWLEDTDAVDTGDFDQSYTEYEVQALYPNGGLSAVVTAMVSNAPPAPTGLNVAVDLTGTNVFLTWSPALGVTTGYTVLRGVFNSSTGNYSYSTIGTVSASTTTFEDVGANFSGDASAYIYEVEANYAGASLSPPVASTITQSSTPPAYNVGINAYLIRNVIGRWQVMISGFPTNGAQTIQLTWSDPNSSSDGNFNPTVQSILTSTLTNGIYQVTDNEMAALLGYTNTSLSVELFGPDGESGQVVQAGTISSDAPYFVDGRQHMKQNLDFLLRSASRYQPFGFFIDGRLNQSATNYEEFSFLHHNSDFSGNPLYITLDNLWPFSENYAFANYLVNTNRFDQPYGGTNFNFSINFANNIPAPPILNVNPYATLQPGFLPKQDYYAVLPIQIPNTNGFPWGVTLSSTQTMASLQSGLYNAFGLPYQDGIEIDFDSTPAFYSGLDTWLDPGVPIYYQSLSPGSSVMSQQSGYRVGAYASGCQVPTLQPVNYYFAPLINPNENSMNLPSGSQQPFPLPIDDSFNVTNQTPSAIVGSVGQPMIVGSWVKYAVSNSSPTKYAYLGQYFTNAYVLESNGSITTNSAGILSPYGDFFPTQSGLAAVITMPDIDPPYEQGTGVVDVISLNVDANHDGTIDLTYGGPDFVSASNPFRFWVNDVNDAGDDGGDGIPGGNGQPPDGVVFRDGDNGPVYLIQGSRNLVNFFPVYLNIGSLFQSNALSTGISATDTNYQFVLSQADGALRFAYTDLTPTNYMNFLRDTNEVFDYLNEAPLTTVSNLNSGGVPVAGYFLNQIAGNNGGIILVEAWTNTTQPLVLTIYHGTSQIAQTSLPLSISSVTSMFRSKTIMLNPESGTNADRLTDASVPNEPNTTDVNFIFVHGYNVNPQQAVGWDSDIYKRLYWSGSHAKFYGVTWEAADSQVAGQVTIDLQTNIVNAFKTAPLLNTFLNSLPGTNVVAAHSLGNMLVLSTLNDCSNRNINTYFMIDAAVAIEAIDTTAPQNPDMYPSAWTNYESRLWASKWFNLWPSNDARSTLTWSGRLQNLQNASVYNFYSSGEEVLRDYPTDPPTTLTGIAIGQLVSLWRGDTGEDTWAWQEKLKGLMLFNSLLSSDHGGWSFNLGYFTYYEDGAPPTPMSAINAVALANSELQTNAFFDFTSEYNGIGTFTADLALYASSGSSYAQANRNRILSDAIPCLTLPLGANVATNLNVEFGETRNFDMQTIYENGWPRGRGKAEYPIDTPAAGEWHHSDNRAVAYTFTYQLFDKMVIVGNLK